MNTIIVNGKKIEFSGNAIINIKRDIVEKNEYHDDDYKTIIEINGNIGNINCNNANIIINGNANKVLTRNGNIKCNNIKGGKVVCNSLTSNNIEGNIYTNNEIIVNKFIGYSYNKKVIDNFKPITNKNQLKEGLTIYHKKYGKGKINWMYTYTTGGSLRIMFDNESYEKTLFIDKIIENKSISVHSPKEIINEFDEEYI